MTMSKAMASGPVGANGNQGRWGLETNSEMVKLLGIGVKREAGATESESDPRTKECLGAINLGSALLVKTERMGRSSLEDESECLVK